MKKTQEQISKNMSHIRSKDTKIEVLLRKELWKRGLRFRKNYSKVYGKPDIVFTKKKIAVFCDSEFFHGYDWENEKTKFKTNKEFWINKIEKNIRRDEEVNLKLKEEGWTVIRFWGKEITKNLEKCADIVEREVKNHDTL